MADEARGNDRAGSCRNPQQALLEALENKDLENFTQLLQDPRVKPRFKYNDHNYSTCLEIASRRPWAADFVRALLTRVNPNVNWTIPEPVHYAAKYGNADVLAALLEDKRTIPAALNSFGRTALHYMCTSVTPWNLEGYEKCAELLITRFTPADINRADKFGFTALHAAAKFNPKKYDPKPEEGSEQLILDETEDEQEERIWNARRHILKHILEIGEDVIDLDSSRAHGHSPRESILMRFPDLRDALPNRMDLSHGDSHAVLFSAMQDLKLFKFQSLLRETDADGNARFDPNHWFGAPLHAYCLELACAMKDGSKYVKALLISGADPNIPNKLTEKFPIHIASEKGYYNILEELFQNSKHDVDPNTSDRLGNTALHYIVENFGTSKSRKQARESVVEYLKCLRKLMERGDLLPNRLNACNKTALQVAVENEKYKAIDVILRGIPQKINVDLRTSRNQDLRKFILEQCKGHIDDLENCLPPLWNNDSRSAKWEREQEMRTTLLEILRKKKRATIFKDKLETKPLIPLSLIDPQNSLLQFAAFNGLYHETKALLEAPTRSETNTSFLPVLVSSSGQWEILKLLMQPEYRFWVDVNKTDMKGNSALHFAVQSKDLQSVILLLHHGAKYKRNNVGNEAFSKNSLRALLNSCVTTNGAPSHAENHETVFDYRLLTATPLRLRPTHTTFDTTALPLNILGNNAVQQRSTVTDSKFTICDNAACLVSEMSFLSVLVHHSSGADLLKHPVTSSFMTLKWRRVRKWTYITGVLWLIFLTFLIVHVMMFAAPKIANVKGTNNAINFSTEQPEEFRFKSMSTATKPFTLYPLVIFSFCLIVREIFRIVNYKTYLKNTENYLGIITLCLTLYLTVSTFFNVQYEQPLWVCLLTIVASCLNVLRLMGRLNLFGRNIEMLKVVFKNYVLAFLSFVVIFLAFAFCFHLTFRDTSETGWGFGDVPFSLLKVLFMTTGELDSSGMPLETTVEGALLFTAFVVGVTLLLQNLLIGLAVSDTQRIERDAEALRLRTRVALVREAENAFRLAHNLLPGRCVRVRAWLAARCALFWPGAGDREARVLTNQGGKVRLHGATTQVGGAERPLSGEVLQAATRVLGERASGGRDHVSLMTEQILQDVRFIRQESQRRGVSLDDDRVGDDAREAAAP